MTNPDVEPMDVNIYDPAEAAAEIRRLRDALREIATETYSDSTIQFAFGHVQRIAEAALEGRDG